MTSNTHVIALAVALAVATGLGAMAAGGDNGGASSMINAAAGTDGFGTNDAALRSASAKLGAIRYGGGDIAPGGVSNLTGERGAAGTGGAAAAAAMAAMVASY